MARGFADSRWLHLVFPFLLAPVSVSAQTNDASARAAARQLAQEGIEAYLAEKYVEAESKLEKGYRLFATPTLGLWSARARMQLGRWVDAAERYRETLLLSGAVGNQATQTEALQDAKKELDALLPRVPSLTLQLEAASLNEVKLTLDGVALSSAFIGVERPTDPGKHELVALRRSDRIVLQVQLAEGEHKLLPVRLGAAEPPLPAAKAPPLAPAAVAAAELLAGVALRAEPEHANPLLFFPLGITLLASGGVGLVVATVTYAMGRATCPDFTCHSKPSQSKYETIQNISTWSFWPGAVLAAGGLTSLWLGSRARSALEHVRLDVGPGSVALRGTF